MELTKNQISKLVLFLKSWGIDDPYLLAEMTDHYGEKALEEMKKGKTLEEVINTWRTKSMFRTFKQIQSNYTKYAKTYWKNKRKEMLKSLLTFKNSLLIIVGCASLLFLLKIQYVGVILTYAAILLSTVTFAMVFYHITFSKKKARLFPQYIYGSLGTILFSSSYLMVMILHDSAFNFEPLSTMQSLLLVILITAVFISLFVLYKLWRYVSEISEHITREMLIQWQVPKFD